MSYVSVIEQVYDELEEFLTDNLPGKIAEYSLEQKDIPLSMFRWIVRGDYQLTDIKPDNFPALIIKPGPVPINPPGEQRAVNKDLLVFNNSFWACNQLNVNSEKYTLLEKLQRMGERYAWAIKEIIDGESYVPTQTTLLQSIMRVTNIDYSAVENGNNTKMQAAFIDIELRLEINRV